MSPAVQRVRPWRRPAALAWALWALGALGMLAVGWMYGLIAEAGRADLGGNGGLAPSLAVVSATTVGASWPAAARRTRWAGCCWGSV
jgi:hypothetical protein